MIELSGGYFIDADDLQYTLQTERKSAGKDGRQRYNTIGYYGTMAAALEAYIGIRAKQAVSSGEVKSLAEYVEKLKELTAYMKSLLPERI